MTFDQMKEWRGDLSDAISKAKRSGEDNKARKIILARDALTEDMRSMASKYGFLDDWEKANSLSKQFFHERIRKGCVW